MLSLLAAHSSRIERPIVRSLPDGIERLFFQTGCVLSYNDRSRAETSLLSLGVVFSSHSFPQKVYQKSYLHARGRAENQFSIIKGGEMPKKYKKSLSSEPYLFTREAFLYLLCYMASPTSLSSLKNLEVLSD